MTREEALRRFKGDLEMLELSSAHKTQQMEMYEVAIQCIEGFKTIDELTLLRYARAEVIRRADEVDEDIDKRERKGKDIPDWLAEKSETLTAQENELTDRIIDLKEEARWGASVPITQDEALAEWLNGKENKLMLNGHRIPQLQYGFMTMYETKTDQFFGGVNTLVNRYGNEMFPQEFRINKEK